MELICPDAFYLFAMSQPRLGGGCGSEGAAEDEDDALAAVHIFGKKETGFGNGSHVRSCAEGPLTVPTQLKISCSGLLLS